MTQREHVNHFEDYRPVDKAIALKFEKYEGPGPENDSRFKLFFGLTWRKSRWNRVVISNMLPVILYKKAEKQLQGEVNDKVISAMLWDHIKQAQESWQRRNPRITQEGNQVETADEARARADTQTLQRYVNVRRNSRKVEKFDKRSTGIEKSSSKPRSHPWIEQNGLLHKLLSRSLEKMDSQQIKRTPTAKGCTQLYHIIGDGSFLHCWRGWIAIS
ncbi:hypothetical protein BDP27DRAFT_208455 [Rhodocollybia butyracea]|uniref:Uncharacterized protein n=1 Tax=Rhodocollybia butyracea TaxID=206335 RepID=A0A9P5PHD9_9AGAR|nr:hypothetical protein BDP27DRAFT_208455 [Rhodocollybia butyracea]